jgi:uncharacterized sulfatase
MTTDFTRRDFLRAIGLGTASAVLSGCSGSSPRGLGVAERPNILFAIADDWSWPHASCGGDNVVKTPTFDRVARQGVLFTNAFVTAPSCTPSRGSIVTGQWHWRLEQGCNLHSTLPAKFDVYPDLLERAGYHVGFTAKGWGPGKIKPAGRTRNPAGPKYENFAEFLKARRGDSPFCFWFGSRDPHRGYKWQSGINSGMKLDDVQVPQCFPDSETVRTDLCDYYWEVQRFDREVGQLLNVLEEGDQLDNTLVVMTSDNGMPFPRCKSNLYDLGTHVPLAVCWGRAIKGGRIVDDFVSLSDLAPTFLQAAGRAVPSAMTGRSLLSILTSNKSGLVDSARDKVITGKERHHGKCRPDGAGYPMRAIRTHEFLYIRNFKPDRWPAGSADIVSSQGTYSDVDRSPTKDYMIQHRKDPKVSGFFQLAFGKRQAEELYDLRKDPGQLNDVAQLDEYAEVKSKLGAALTAELIAGGDPRIGGKGDAFDSYPYYVNY